MRDAEFINFEPRSTFSRREFDAGIPNDGVDRMRAALKAAGRKSEIITYPDTPHGFHADYRPSYREQPAKEGWAKLLAWFKANGVG